MDANHACGISRFLKMLLVVLLFSPALLRAQSAALQPMTPLSPNAASLGKYGEIPVSLYTGVPNIQIPLYEINVSGFTLPISISYHASGIKVGDVASFVGLGWSLNAGGVINRRQNGIMDERMVSQYSLHASEVTTMSNPATPLATKNAIAENWYSSTPSQRYDVEPDIFTFNFANKTGQFFLDPQNNVTMMPVDNRFDVKHEETYTPPNSQTAWARWIIKDNDGVEYVFGRTKDDAYDNFEQSCVWGTEQPCYLNVNSWYLSQIILPNGKKIDFKYDYVTYSVAAPAYSSNYAPNACFAAGGYSAQTVDYERVLRLKEIVFPNGKVVFTAGALRQDIADKCLEKLEVFTASQGGGTVSYSRIKSYKFTYSGRRPKLVAVEELDLGTNQYDKAHTFTYNSTSLPQSFVAGSQDLWGYYNGISQNNLVPALINVNLGGGAGNTVPGANRAVDPDFTQAEILTSITYPTGGKNTFEYENNTAVCNSNTNGFSFCNVLNYTYQFPREDVSQLVIQASNSGAGTYVYSSDIIITAPNVFTFDDRFMASGSADCSPTVYSGQTNYGCATFDLQKKEANNTYTTVAGDFWFDMGISVQAGTYRVRMRWNSNDAGMFYATLHYSEEKISDQIDPTENEFFVGGLRIKRITTYDPVSNKNTVKRYEYTFNDTDAGYAPGVTSGMPMNIPIFVHNAPICRPDVGICAPLTITSTPMANILSGDNVPVGYRKVTVYNDEAGAFGKSENYYTTAEDYPDQGVNASANWPFPNARSYHWRRGLEERRIDYAFVSNEYKRVRQLESLYSFSPSTSTNYRELTATKIYTATVVSGMGACLEGGGFAQYKIGTESVFLSQQIETTFATDGSTIGVARRDVMTQNQKSLQTELATRKNSDGKEAHTLYKYPQDYTLTASTLSTEAKGIKNLVTQNVVTRPIEELTIVKLADGSEAITGGTITLYHADKALPWRVFRLNTNTPIPRSSFTFSSVNTSGTFIKDNRYVELSEFVTYDTGYNPLEEQRSDVSKLSYLWSYNGQYLVAMAENATRTDIAYAGFESEGKGNWSYSGATVADATAPTGKRAYNLSGGALSKSGLTSSLKYLLTYWAKSGSAASISGGTATVVHTVNGWTLYKRVVTGVTSVSLTGSYRVDDVRLHPTESSMTTYTYDPLVGMTSQTDAAGQITRYEYDSYGRLMAVRDHYNNIVEAYQYNYRP